MTGSPQGQAGRSRWSCDRCRDWTTVTETTVLGDGVTFERAVACPVCQPATPVRQFARDCRTDAIGVVMWSRLVLGPGGLVTKYALRPPNGGLEWMAEDIELLEPQPVDSGRPRAGVPAEGQP